MRKNGYYYGTESVKAPLRWLLDFAFMLLMISLLVADKLDLLLKRIHQLFKKGVLILLKKPGRIVQVFYKRGN